MHRIARPWTVVRALSLAVVLTTTGAFAFQSPQQTSQLAGRFDTLIIQSTEGRLQADPAALSSLSATERVRTGWEAFRIDHGPQWTIFIDRRSGAPLLVQGQGIPWTLDKGATADVIADSVRKFISGNKDLLLAEDTELAYNSLGSGQLVENVSQVVFDHVVSGIPVIGEHYVFVIGHGNLISFGAPGWSKIDASPLPDLSADEAHDRLLYYMSLTDKDTVTVVLKPRLEFLPLRAANPSGMTEDRYVGAIGAGYTSALVWHMAVTVAGEDGEWTALIDAHSGKILSFYNATESAQIKGGVYPLSNDQICPEGCEQPDYPMPYADVYRPDWSYMTATSTGLFDCSPAGLQVATNLNGHYFRIASDCGLLSQLQVCSSDLNMGFSAVDQCAVPPGGSQGNTLAMRTTFYHLNREREHVLSWLPDVAWLLGTVEVGVDPVFLDAHGQPDVTKLCNAWWTVYGGVSLQLGRGSTGCRNFGENASVIYHEWGHGLDQFDGGDFSNPGEGYADVTSLMMTHNSCMGRGINIATGSTSGLCQGYGNNCLTCTGARELDWDKKIQHTPAQGLTNCPAPGLAGLPGPCGKEVHCEGIAAGEAMWDFANRDLPAGGMDVPSAWKLADKLWFTSRRAAGGNMWYCSLANGVANGCFQTSMFNQLKILDDDDGDLSNGTPHAAAIFAALNRHGIACGLATDATNQNHSACPTFVASTLSGDVGNGSASLSWTPVPGATKYRILRSEGGCDWSSTPVATITGTSYVNTGLANGMTEYYRVQALGTNSACDGPVSNCQAILPEPFAGILKLGAAGYKCNGPIGITVTDGNIGAATTVVSVQSTTEPSGESVTLTQVSPGSSTYTGTISTTPAAPAADGLLSVANGDTITVTYLEADDGGGHLNIPRVTTAQVDCANSVISKVQATNVTGTGAKITWTTNEPANSTVKYGPTPPPASTASVASNVVAHSVELSGLSECTSYAYSATSADVVGNLTTDDASGSYYGFTTGKTTIASYGSIDTPLAIPDGFSGGATSVINVTDQRTVQDINVIVNVQHTYDADLTFTLITPTGQQILLANPHGGSGDNYTNTVFDDDAATGITGIPPFTGTFRPDSPMSVAEGIASAGPWGFKAVDSIGQDVGQILSWTLQLTYATPTCGPHALVRSAARVSDACATGGTGSGNTYWDAGEHVRFKLTLANDGTTPLTAVSATVAPVTAGVVMDDATAFFPDIPAAGSADSLSPHVTAHLPTSLACGAPVAFQVTIHSDQGTFSGTVGDVAGRATNGTGRVLAEGFDNGIPATWSVVDGGSGGNAAATWTTGNPGVRTIAAPMVLPVATVDSDAAGPGAVQDESLVTPVINMSTATTAVLQFDEFFRWFSGGQDEIADVDVRSSLTGNTWVNVLRQQGASSANPAHKSLDISAQAAGASNTQVRFRDYNGSNEEYWQVDNVTIDTSAVGSCDMPTCSAPVPGGAKPVPDGLFGAAMRASRSNPGGTSIGVTWDVDLCASGDNHILYGNLASVASMTVTGAACDLGTSGSATWSSVPAGNLWFVIVGDDNATTEASWGTDGIGGQRGGAAVSGQCGLTVRDNSGVCP